MRIPLPGLLAAKLPPSGMTPAEHAIKQPAIPGFASTDEWVKAIREWAGSHPAKGSEADWSRESIYADRDE